MKIANGIFLLFGELEKKNTFSNRSCIAVHHFVFFYHIMMWFQTLMVKIKIWKNGKIWSNQKPSINWTEKERAIVSAVRSCEPYRDQREKAAKIYIKKKPKLD